MERKLTSFHLFNCDNTYNLNAVEALLLKMEDKLKFKVAVEKRYFRLQQMKEICETVIPKLKMDFAIFAVHAHESRLSINEDNAGIGYARFYRALLQATEGRVLIVIGGDDQYRHGDEEEHTVISRWARRKVASQFNEEFLDGRESFIFSWNKQHREIHEEALLHYFDPDKKGQKFAHQPKPTSVQDEPEETLPPVRNIQQEFVVEDDREQLVLSDEDGAWGRSSRQNGKYDDCSATPDYPEGMVLLDTLLRHGEISYDAPDVRNWHHKWKPSQETVQNLQRDWMLISVAKVQFRTCGVGGVCCRVYQVDRITACVFNFRRWVLNNPIKFCLIVFCLFPICVCYDKIKGCVIGTFHCIRRTLISFYEWLREKCHKRLQGDI